ncbi:hypothetical protein BDR04DRAFT_1128746 [Suillus decipiens]|nr:hypothetical protein BDR04DRAFT_1128746 [Suillus decipiens]
MPANHTDHLLNLWATTLLKHGESPPFANHQDLYSTINSIPLGEVKWQGFSCTYPDDKKPDGSYPPWMDEVVCNMLANPIYSDEMDYHPYHKYSTDGNECQFQDFMSADWAWEQADIIAGDPETLGSMFVPIILGSDKMMVLVATSNNEYYPLYLSIGNVHNNVQWSHWDAVAIIGFLAMPKSMTKLEVAKFGDGYFRRVIYGLGPYITDYEEQVLLTCIVHYWCTRLCSLSYTQLFPQADIYHLITPNLLHQIIKGTFKDHLVSWITAVASFTGLHHFPQGWGFKKWMEDNSKALMKMTVYLAAIYGHVPQAIVHAFRAFLEFCYLVCQNTITESTLAKIQDALSHYHQHRTIFVESGAITTFSLPHQHSLIHYVYLIQQFSAPNGLCSSITKSKHIKAVKEPWGHSSKHNALGQMLVTDQHLNKLAAAHVDFANHRIKCACNVLALVKELNLPCFPDLILEWGMQVEHIHVCPLWQNEALCNDCIFINIGSSTEGIQGLEVARVHAFFSFKYGSEIFSCAILHWFDVIGDLLDEDIGMWMVHPAYSANHTPLHSIIHAFLPSNINLHTSYDAFQAYYVNKYVDHHAFKIAS